MSIIDDPLFAAILAMDAYNRADGAGLKVSGVQLGNATVRTDALPGGSQSSGFFAQVYTWNNETIISYRGTDISRRRSASGYPLRNARRRLREPRKRCSGAAGGAAASAVLVRRLIKPASAGVRR